MNVTLHRDTVLCLSLSARPSHFGTRFHNYLFQHYKLDFIYKAFGITDLEGALAGIRALGIRGSAVSMPFKERCMEYLDDLDASAEKIGAVNTIVNDHGRLKGFNTDYLAVMDLLNSAEANVKTAFIIYGSGGMAKAVLAALKAQGFVNGQVVSRNKQTGSALAKRYGYDWSAEPTAAAAILINASPIGMNGGPDADRMPFQSAWIEKAELIFDVVAMPSETPLIRKARELKKQVITGAEVVERQAAEQFYLYTGVRPQPDVVAKASAFARSPIPWS